MESQILVIFGASGDLAKRKLIPALYELSQQGLLPERFAVLGVSRSALSDEDFRERVTEFLPESGKSSPDIETFLRRLSYLSLQTGEPAEYERLKKHLEELSTATGIPPNTIYYLSTPPSLYEVIPRHLNAVRLSHSDEGFRRLIVEKPFGSDLSSAQDLNRNLLSYFREDQIYRIDHYLGKETVQNMLVTRFANGIFEPIWNHNFIHHVEITSAESLGVEGRGGYYDHSGALRDMVQNHLLHLVGMVAMEPPVVIEADAIRNEVLKVFQSLRPIAPDQITKHVVRGQYIASTIKGDPVKGYREEEGVNPLSRTETFVALKFFIDSWRWGGVPFYIRTGKKLPARVAEVVIHFKRPPRRLFQYDENALTHYNQLILRVQPDEGILLKFGLKVPGAGFRVQTVNMDFHYDDLANSRLPSPYARLLLDCMQGDATLYARGDTVEEAWKFIQPISDVFASGLDMPIYGYPAGTWGPEEVEEIMDDANWRYPCKNLVNDGNYCEL